MSTTRPTLLIVDDEPAMRSLVEALALDVIRIERYGLDRTPRGGLA